MPDWERIHKSKATFPFLHHGGENTDLKKIFSCYHTVFNNKPVNNVSEGYDRNFIRKFNMK